MDKDFKWKCIICEENVRIIFDGNIKVGLLPNIEGGDISLTFRYW